ncbi:unnamed protein product [Rotaria sp. Silwood1]|nr:unnamed protein product [Rotaria sp. Silwood1]CAF3637107.1 unnamed protein product [Rotaria sp. Silwood1]CAF4648199.1 unnamed protein product [Rotaria sp. Silwood1]CAF4829460.1 unnamed protein product [Rotaria sp. Silwood1]
MISNLNDIYHDNNQLFHQSTRNINNEQHEIKVLSNIDEINPCSGSYIKTNGTTCNLKDIIIGRCYEYQYIKRSLHLSNRTEIKNCTKLYELFETAVRYKPYCSMNLSTYENYFQYALDGIQIFNRAMFWSGTYSIAHTYGNHGFNYITLEDTLAATTVNGLRWCGKDNDTEGFDYISCPYNCKDNIWADDAFWGIASKNFAEKAVGEVYLVLNGSRTDGQLSFRNNSYFAKYELPNLQRTGIFRVTKLNVLLLHSPDQQVVEKCGEKSLIYLETLVQSYQIEYLCKDDPEELILMMCSDNWEARECQLARQVLRKEWDKKLFGKSNVNYHHSISFLILFSFLVNYFIL